MIARAALRPILLAGLLVTAGTSLPAAAQDLPVPPDDWMLGACTAITRLNEVQPDLIGLGEAATAGDIGTMQFDAVSAGLTAAAALDALNAITSDYPDGDNLRAFLTDAALVLVDLGSGLAQADPADAAAVRTALGNVIAAYDDLANVGVELTTLRQVATFDCADVPIPSAPPLPQESFAPDPDVTPAPPVIGDKALEALFPPTLGGKPTQVESRTGPELVARADPDDIEGQQGLQALSDFLDAHGTSMDALSLAFAFAFPTQTTGVSLTALRVKGADAAALLDGLLPLLTSDYLDPRQATVTVGGRELLRVSDGVYDPEGIYEYLLPVGEVLWAVSATEPTLSEIIGQLPSP